ncbi:PmoA family protein [Spirosoma taeanense]|uniref:PmoA family protein n=1 Tax=Spirosoma taeanense TaxID=2735870 RepID=A0A6M5Y7Z5_9BACT|nr:PmoA family protein [Spirosoma taeanense]QJW88852.1 PmoA family protein [Spirosoma taeanense]
MRRILLTLLLAASTILAEAQTNAIKITHDEARKRVDVTVDGKPFTAYIYPGPTVLKKPVLYPILSAGGNPITRGWPLDPRPGERVDHPHHVGMWFNYGDVNGHDFWNNSTDIGPEHKGPFGTIVHTGITSTKNGKGQGELVVTADWLDKDGNVMLQETTTFQFRADANSRTIDRITSLKAGPKDVVFKDNKEGMIAVRMARQLEMPSTKPEVFTDAQGVATKVPAMNNAGVTGMYHSSEGVEGDAVWGTRGRWVNLTGTLGSEPVSVVLIDHPQNVGYPTYWHARGYGLFAANPLGPSVLSSGKAPAMNYTLPSGKSVTFRYRLLIASGNMPEAAINQRLSDFSNL